MNKILFRYWRMGKDEVYQFVLADHTCYSARYAGNEVLIEKISLRETDRSVMITEERVPVDISNAMREFIEKL